MFSVGLGEQRGTLDAASARTTSKSELDVALVTPGGAPRVLDEPVAEAVLETVADSEDSVVELGAACA